MVFLMINYIDTGIQYHLPIGGDIGAGDATTRRNRRCSSHGQSDRVNRRTQLENQAAVRSLTDTMAKFTAYIGKHLPTDVEAKLKELRSRETQPLAKAVYTSMAENQDAANKLDRPSCQDTGVIQYFITAGARFPLLGELEDILRNATLEATRDSPLRHNAVETFVEKNTGTNTGTKVPWLDWEIVPDDDGVTIDVYMAGGGCTLPGRATVLMPGQGYEGVTEFVFDVITSRGVNACPPLLVGVGVSTAVETAAQAVEEGADAADRFAPPRRRAPPGWKPCSKRDSTNWASGRRD